MVSPRAFRVIRPLMSLVVILSAVTVAELILGGPKSVHPVSVRLSVYILAGYLFGALCGRRPA